MAPFSSKKKTASVVASDDVETKEDDDDALMSPIESSGRVVSYVTEEDDATNDSGSWAGLGKVKSKKGFYKQESKMRGTGTVGCLSAGMRTLQTHHPT